MATDKTITTAPGNIDDIPESVTGIPDARIQQTTCKKCSGIEKMIIDGNEIDCQNGIDIGIPPGAWCICGHGPGPGMPT